ncbi:MAG TPA: 1-deoxy-D-xylulose-5-phosphate reductoisomerase [Deltaproteobacteria bacterium]|nr:1-deoxy-D-xylulose-5-phosphate reductoisomerase [Deltaproteobacteria bacterium]
MKNIAILGSTGSIGVSTVEVVLQNPSRFSVCALAAGRNLKLMKEQIETFRPRIVSVIDHDHARQLRDMLGQSSGIEILWGGEGYREVATCREADMVLSAIVGAAGLLPTVDAIEAGKDVALANKETMVMAGRLVVDKAKSHGVNILPVDSEHGAIFQCLVGHNKADVRKIILTASGGPFFRLPKEKMHDVTLEDALKHPNWDMGAKITIDSATMMNKGLEVIEAMWFFDVDIDRIDVLIHPQSIVHSMVEYNDGSSIAQLGVPDMKGPIAYALSYPERLHDVIAPLSLSTIGTLEFFSPDFDKFKNLDLAYRAAARGGTAPAVLNAANEVAVEAFINGDIGFMDLPDIVEEVVTGHEAKEPHTIADVLEADRNGRKMAREIVERLVLQH